MVARGWQAPKVVLLAICLAVSMYAAFFEHAALAKGWHKLIEACHFFLYDKEIIFEGLNTTPTKNLETLLPLNFSVVYWLVNMPRLERALEQHPLVAQAKLRRCSTLAWGCFVAAIKERRPSAIAAIAKRAWIVGEDGAYIAPFPGEGSIIAELSRADPERLLNLPVIEGVLPEGGSMEVAKSRLQHALKSISLIEAESGYKISRLSIRDHGEIRVNFQGLKLEAVFDAIKGESKRLRREARRFKRVMSEFAGREALLSRVDLAYDKVAVITLTNTSSIAGEKHQSQ